MSEFEQSPTNSTGKRRAGCEGCRLRHLKCDGQARCAQCAKRNQPCVRGTRIRFRHNDNPGLGRGQYDFPDGQPWIKTSHRKIRFVDESEEISAFYEGDSALAVDDDQSLVVPEPPQTGSTTTIPQIESSHREQSDAETELPHARKSRKSYSFSSTFSYPGGYTHHRKTRPSKSFSSTFSYASSRLSTQHEYPSVWPETTAANQEPSPASERVRQPSTSSVVELSHFPDLSAIPHPLPSTSHPLPPISASLPFRDDFSVSSMLGSPAACIQLESSPLPLKKALEANLMRHYVVNLAPSFDVGEHEKTFATHVAETATVCRPLLQAILAVSAESLRNNNTITTLDIQEQQQLYEMIQYRDEYMACLMLAPNTSMDNESLLAAAVLMRHLTDIQAPVRARATDTGSLPRQPHSLVPILNTMISPLYIPSTHSLQAQPIYWASLRQEIYLAILTQRLPTPLVPVPLLTFDRSLGSQLPPPSSSPHNHESDSSEDDIWAKKITLNLVDVAQYCFGDGDRNLSTYSMLMDYTEKWMKSKPPTFEPIFIQERQENDADRMFPEVILLNNSVILGLQYYYLCRMLLIAFDPGIPRLGFEHRVAMRAIDDKLRSGVRMVCGIANSLSEMNPAHLAASMAIALAGDRFDDRAEQYVLLDILQRTQQQYGWSTSAEDLKKSWGIS